MNLCVCGHQSDNHRQFDPGESCRYCNCDRYRKAAGPKLPTAILSAGGSPEGLAPETIAESVNRAGEPRTEAGWALLSQWTRHDNPMADEIRAAILAIEREARAGEPRTEAEQDFRWLLMALDWEVFRQVPGLYSSGEMRDIRARIDAAIEREAAAAPALDVDELAQIIRQVDGQHSLGAGALAEAIIARLSEKAP